LGGVLIPENLIIIVSPSYYYYYVCDCLLEIVGYFTVVR